MRLNLLITLTLFTVVGLSAQSDFKTTTSLFGDLQARQIGPAVMSGRVTSLAIPDGAPEVVYIGTAGGGVWKSIAGGPFIRPVFDEHTQSIGKVAVAPSDAKTVWVGTGEPWTRNSVSVGTGVYKSTNAGSTWKSMGLEATERIADIAIHPENPDIVYVAALGHLWDANEERGVYKTTDGGQTWEKILYIDEHTGAADLSLDPSQPDVLFAAMWSFRREPWTFDSGFNGNSGLYKTTDGGANWKAITEGLPTEKLGRIGVAIAPSNSKVVYASIEAKTEENKGFYRSTDGGDSWEQVNTTFNTKVRPFYFSNITIDPQNDSIVAKCGYTPIISEDAGDRFRAMGVAVHSDIHDIWINPANGKHLIVGTDGGVYESFDRGQSFKMWMNLPVSQFYHVSVDMADPYNVYGGLQDNGSWYGPSRKAGGITNSDWFNTYGGDGFYSFRHPTESNIIYSEFQGGELVRFDENTGVAKSIKPYAAGEEEKLRFNWNAPIHLSATNPDRLYFGAQYLFRSNDMGDSWERISPDLTTNDPEKQQQARSGGLSIDNSTAENHTTIYAIAESPQNDQLIWVGTDDGNLQVSNNGGESWTNVIANVPDLPANTWVTFIEPSPHDANTAYVTFDGHRTGDMTPYLYRTTDGGKSWTALTDENVAGYALSVRQDLVNPNLLFLGTEFGLFISVDAGKSWAHFTNNLPQAGIRDMVIHPRDHDLVMATHGRGIIILDDIEALRQLSPEIASNKDITFLNAEPTLLRDPGASGGWFGGSGDYRGSNPSGAARIIYYAPKRHTFGKMFVEVYQDGELIKSLPAGKSAGINVVSMPTAMKKPKSAPTNNRAALGGSLFGPNLQEGTYQVKVVKGKKTYDTEFQLAYDPKSPYSMEGRVEQREAAMELYQMSEELAYIYQVLEDLTPKVKAIEGLPKRRQYVADSLAVRIARLKDRISFTGGDFYVNEEERLREEVSNLYRVVSQYPGKPTETQLQELGRLSEKAAQLEQDFGLLVVGDVAQLNNALERAKLPILDYTSREAFFDTPTGGSQVDGQKGMQLLEDERVILRLLPFLRF